MVQNIPEKLNHLSRVHARHRRQTTDRQTDRSQIDGFAIAYSQTSRLAKNHEDIYIYIYTFTQLLVYVTQSFHLYIIIQFVDM